MTRVPDTDDAWFIALGVLVLGAVCFAVAGQRMLDERKLRLPAHSPAQIAEVFVNALRLRRWDVAKACLSHSALAPTLRPEIPDLKVTQARHNLKLKDQLQAYWKPFVEGSGFGTANFGLVGINHIHEAVPGLAVIRAELNLSRTVTVPGVGTSVTTLEFDGKLYAYERNGKWLLLSGGLPCKGGLADFLPHAQELVLRHIEAEAEAEAPDAPGSTHAGHGPSTAAPIEPNPKQPVAPPSGSRVRPSGRQILRKGSNS